MPLCGPKMCTKDCYKVFGYFLGFLWIVTSFYYTMETIELLKLMNLQCTQAAPEIRIQFDKELVEKVCEFYGHLGKILRMSWKSKLFNNFIMF